MNDGARRVDHTTIIARKAIAGDADALSSLVEKFNPPLLALARRRMSERLQRGYAAEDAVADTWVAALPKLSSFDEEEGRVTPRVMGFLSKTLINRVNTLFQKIILGKPERAADPESAGVDGMLGFVAAPLRGPVTEAMSREDHDHVHRALDSLDERGREIILLRAFQQLAHKDVASLLGISPDNSKQLYSRALKKLADNLPESIFPELLADESSGGASVAKN